MRVRGVEPQRPARIRQAPGRLAPYRAAGLKPRPAGAESREPSERATLTAVHDDRRPVDPAGAAAGKERHHVPHFLGTAEPAHRDLALDELGHGGGIFLLPLPPGAALERD